jgi:hypothetical protein
MAALGWLKGFADRVNFPDQQPRPSAPASWPRQPAQRPTPAVDVPAGLTLLDWMFVEQGSRR